MWDQVGNPEDGFSHNEAQMIPGSTHAMCLEDGDWLANSIDLKLNIKPDKERIYRGYLIFSV